MIRTVPFLVMFLFLADISAPSFSTPSFFKTAASPRTTSSSRYKPSPITTSSPPTGLSPRTAFSIMAYLPVPPLGTVQHPAPPTIPSFQRNTSPPSPFASPKTTTSPPTKGKTEIVLRIPERLQIFSERLEKRCDFTSLDAVYTDLKTLWATVMKGENENMTMEMGEAQKFIKKLLELYNKCVQEEDGENVEVEWERYTKIFGKEYTSGEKEMRKEIFRKNKKDLKKHNKLYRNDKFTYNVSLNHFSDWTDEELERTNGFRPPNATSQGGPKRVARLVEGIFWKHYYYNPHDVHVPASIDWRTRKYVTPVKHQGTCGSCYAIAGNGALEAYHKKRTGDLVILSTQNILDCTWHLGNKGCDRGFHHLVFNYAVSTGVVPNFRYPYTMNASHNCRWRREHAVATNKGYYFVEKGSELALRNAIANYGPVAVGIGTKGLREYRFGVFKTEDCGPATHVVLVVGYGTDPLRGDYWIIRNSWGFWWGEDGYYRMARNRNNMCDIATDASFPF